MASLTHVCMWLENGWKPISADEAAKMHPGGTVSAHSGLFMCELCGQYVTLVDGDRMVRHFRHSAAEKSKNCPERTFGAAYTPIYKASEHDLPLRIVNITSSDFRFELGLVRIPRELFSYEMIIHINLPGESGGKYAYKGERLNPDTITYVDVGNNPERFYDIDVPGADRSIYQFWPSRVSGIDPEGTVFDQETGCKLSVDADVEVGKKYYILTRIPLHNRNKHVRSKEILRKSVRWMTWCLYEIEALDYDESSARFFLDYHCRLTEHPAEIRPIWPITIQAPYVLKHRDDRLTLVMKGNATAHVFPHTSIINFPERYGAVIEVRCEGRQQLLSIGRASAIRYAYFWKESLEYQEKSPRIEVTTISGKPVQSGEADTLPPEKSLRITCEYDGFITLYTNKKMIERRRLQANTATFIDKIRFGVEIEVYVGCDCVWSLSFRRKTVVKRSEEAEILRELISAKGNRVQAPHTLGSLVQNLSQYPLIRNWLYDCIRRGEMTDTAYRRLKSFSLNTGRSKENE